MSTPPYEYAIIKTKLALKILANRLQYLLLFLVFGGLGWYELVQDKRRKFPPPTNAACTIYSKVTYQIFGIILTLMNSRRGWQDHFFSWPKIGATTVVVAKTYPHRPQSSKGPTMVTRFRQDKTCLPFFLNEATAGAPRHVCKTRKHSKIWPAYVKDEGT